MKTLTGAFVLAAAICLMVIMPMAQDQGHEGHEHEMQGEMPPMGPPEEMTEMADMVGTWVYDGEMRMTPESEEWIPFTGTAVFEYDVDGAALRMDYTSEFMGKPFIGQSLTAYDRETERWQESWIDHMGGRISMYTGGMVDGKRIMTGENMMNGQTYLGRQISSDFTDDTFTWVAENSFDGGETWHVMMRGTYTRQ